MAIGSNQTRQNHLGKDIGYVIDTSAFIKLDPYYLDVFPTLWTNLENIVDDGLLVAPHEVFIEIQEKYDDGWNKWAKKHKTMFLDKREIQTIATRIENWHRGLTDETDTKTDADYYVIALAQYMGNWTVVSEESRRKTNKIKIPNVCDKMKISCVDLHNFFKKCGWKY